MLSSFLTLFILCVSIIINMEKTDITIIGAGIVGLAVAAELAGEGRSLFVIDKNETFGMETSSRNSEVIHAGIYYPTGTLKHKLCIEGNRLIYEICRNNSSKIYYSCKKKRV